MRMWPCKIPPAHSTRENRRTAHNPKKYYWPGSTKGNWVLRSSRSHLSDHEVIASNITWWVCDRPSQAHAGQFGLILLPDSVRMGTTESSVQSHTGWIQLGSLTRLWMRWDNACVISSSKMETWLEMSYSSGRPFENLTIKASNWSLEQDLLTVYQGYLFADVAISGALTPYLDDGVGKMDRKRELLIPKLPQAEVWLNMIWYGLTPQFLVDYDWAPDWSWLIPATVPGKWLPTMAEFPRQKPFELKR